MKAYNNKYTVVAKNNATGNIVTISQHFYTRSKASAFIKKREKEDKTSSYKPFTGYRIVKHEVKNTDSGQLEREIDRLTDEFDMEDILDTILQKDLTPKMLEIIAENLQYNGYIAIKVATQKEQERINEFIEQNYTYNQTPLF